MGEVWVTIGAAVIGAGASVYGTQQANKRAKNGAVPYEEVDYTQVQADAVQGNLINSSSIEDLLKRGNTFNASQALSIQNQTMPGYSALAKSLTTRAQGLVDNPYDVPKEVEDNLARLAAERGISAGTRGQFNDFSLLRDFGVNQLQYGRENLNQAGSITTLLASIKPKVNVMSPMDFYVTPVQREATVANNNAQSQAIAQAALNAQNAAKASGDANMLGSIGQLAGLAGMFAGSSKNTNPSNDVVTTGTASGLGDYGMSVKYCWVAREVYGADNPSWTDFRDIMLREMPKDFVDFYGEHGPEIARQIEDKPEIKTLIRGLMDEIRKTHAPAHT